MSKSSIEWTDYTFNPWHGCTKISPGCANCYAETMGRRFGTGWGQHADRKINDQKIWDQPLVWNCAAAKACERRRVFVLSMGDWLDDKSELTEPLALLLWAIQATPWLDWLLVTKRPNEWQQRMARVKHSAPRSEKIAIGVGLANIWLDGGVIPNIWVLTSVENQAWAEKRIPSLLRIPARGHGLICEPLLEPIHLTPFFRQKSSFNLNWVIAGGESGPKARPCDFAWLRSLRHQCQRYGVPFFLKQLGSNPHGDWLCGEPPTHCALTYSKGFLTHSTKLSRCKNGRWKLVSSKGCWLGEWPDDLRVREFPKPLQTEEN